MNGTCVLAWGDRDSPFQQAGAAPVHHEPGRYGVHHRLWRLANHDDGFYGWLRIANSRCEAIDRLSLLDLPLGDWRNQYDGRVPPEEAADVALDAFAAVHGVTAR